MCDGRPPRTGQVPPDEAGGAGIRHAPVRRRTRYRVAERVFPARLMAPVGPDEARAGEGRSGGGVAARPKPGASARSPLPVSLADWKEILLRVYREIADDRVLALAAGVAYYGLLALFPAIAALVAIYGLFADPADIARHLSAVSGILPGVALELLRGQMERLAGTAGGSLGLFFVLSVLLSLWSANAGMKAIIDTLNVVCERDERRGFIKLNAVSLLFTVSAIVLLLLAVAAVIVIPILLRIAGLGAMAGVLLGFLRWPALFLAMAFVLALLYRYGPDREPPRWRWISFGSLTASLAWLAASALFSWYVSHFNSFDRTYGSLGAVVVFMTWMWLSAAVILLGAELDAEIEQHRTMRDKNTSAVEVAGPAGGAMAGTLEAGPD